MKLQSLQRCQMTSSIESRMGILHKHNMYSSIQIKHKNVFRWHHPKISILAHQTDFGVMFRNTIRYRFSHVRSRLILPNNRYYAEKNRVFDSEAPTSLPWWSWAVGLNFYIRSRPPEPQRRLTHNIWRQRIHIPPIRGLPPNRMERDEKNFGK